MFKMVRWLCGIEPLNNSVNSVHSVKEFLCSDMNLDASAMAPCPGQTHLNLQQNQEFMTEFTKCSEWWKKFEFRAPNDSVIFVHSVRDSFILRRN